MTETPTPTAPTQDAINLPATGQVWMHHSGRVYRVLMLTNENSTDQERFPTTVVYENIHNATRWSRPLTEFITRFEFLPADHPENPNGA